LSNGDRGQNEERAGKEEAFKPRYNWGKDKTSVAVEKGEKKEGMETQLKSCTDFTPKGKSKWDIG